MQTGENIEGLRKILDMTRMISIVLLLIHIYYFCYAAFLEWQLTSKITDQLLDNIARTGLFKGFHRSKLIALSVLLISLIGAKGRKNEKLEYTTAFSWLICGQLIFWTSGLLIFAPLKIATLTMLYIACLAAGFIMTITGGTILSRIIHKKFSSKDVFNKINETFPQEERLLENEFSINLPAKYFLKTRERKSWINIVNPFRGIAVLGSPGAGKSYFVIRHIITQHIAKGFSMFVYDFKFDDLSVIVYNHFLRHKDQYPPATKFYVINFDDLSKSHRCNPLDPGTMTDITDAAESARTILMGLNREWIKKQGDFFVESPINFLTAIIWFLKKFRGGEYCTLPHVIELMQIEYDRLFSILRLEKEIEVLINPFINAYQHNAVEQLEGQIASAKVAMARLASPQLYYILSGNDFSLDINNPDEPKLVCMGNNPQKIQIYGAVLSLYVTRLVKLVNKKGKRKSSLIFDEFPTIYLNNMDSLIATARSNKVSTTLGIQDFSQLRKDYGKEQADVIVNITGNVIAGQVTGDTAKQLSERFGKIMQDRESFSVNSSDTSLSRSRQLEMAIPASRISGLSSGEFVGMVADNPEEKIELKAFHSAIQNDHKAINEQIASYKPIPVFREIDNGSVERNYDQVRKDIEELVEIELERMLNNPGFKHLILNNR
ncbi:MAG: conjugal transfer protein MobC [Agriterribacter sp.]